MDINVFILKIVLNDITSFMFMENNIWWPEVTSMVIYGVDKCKGSDFRFG